MYDVVAIEPAFGPEHDEVTEIDAIKAFVPEPSSGCLALLGLMGACFARARARGRNR
jgi:hypothetical protein